MVEYMRVACSKGVTSISLANMQHSQELKDNINKSINYLKRNKSDLPLRISTQLNNDDHAKALIEVITVNNNSSDNTDHLRDILQTESNLSIEHAKRTIGELPHMQQVTRFSTSTSNSNNSGIEARVNLLIDIDPFFDDSDSPIKSVIEAGEILGSLCDQGAKVINLTLCLSDQRKLEDIDEVVSERVTEYVMDIIEEGLNLDVAGDPLLERLSIQCPSSAHLPGVTALVRDLRLTRIAVCGVSQSDVTANTNTDTNQQEQFRVGNKQVLFTSINDPEVQSVIADYVH
mmetsp:Transcript_106873/g.209478  ORF Transcript_106873/g.209478 Transcript_106873/m.209478 type:complete len:288 (-) Transcript_106873:57-920(-)